MSTRTIPRRTFLAFSGVTAIALVGCASGGGGGDENAGGNGGGGGGGGNSTPRVNGGVVTTLAGTAGVSGSTNGLATLASFFNPAGIAVDSSGNVFLSDQSNHLIRKISVDGNVTTVAGTSGVAGFSDGLGTSALFDSPGGIAIDSFSNLFVADINNACIRKIDSTGNVTTYAGNGTRGYLDDTGMAAQFDVPLGVAVDASGNLFVSDSGSNNLIRKVDTSGVVTTFAGDFALGPGFNDTGIGVTAQFWVPNGIAVDKDRNVYVADLNNHRIRKINSSGTVTTLAGSGNPGYVDANGVLAEFNAPNGIAVDPWGNVYVTNQNCVRKITPLGDVTTLAGDVNNPGSIDDTGISARFASPNSLASDSSANLFVSDQGNHLIRKIT